MKKKKLFPKGDWQEQELVLAVLDVVSVLASYFLAILLRFDFHFSAIEPHVIPEFLRSIGPWALATVAMFYVCRLYHTIWSLAGTREAESIVKAYLYVLPVYVVIALVMNLHLPRSYYVMGFLINICATVAMRFSYRFLQFWRLSMRRGDKRQNRIMVIGAGAAGQMIIKEIQNSRKLDTVVCCVIDDNPSKKDRLLEGVKIVGNRHDIVNMAKKYRITTIIFTIPSCSPKDRTEILNICKETNCKMKIIPGMYQLVGDEVSVSRLRDVEISDLLGREQIRVDNENVFASLQGKVVLVTGGGGSIGSELCRQIASANPKQLIIFEIYENNAYDIQQELKYKFPELNLKVLIGSVRNTNRITGVMRTYHPDVLFHAAAHKHVPLMEDSPNEAIKNNVLGTYKTAAAAAENGVKKFVLISTDKAVNPTNIMGASKRLCEMVVQMMDRRYPNTSFVAVRFGNVLGSNGSVIPLFKKQIAAGGPVTVTDKRIIRYFMTIPEAVSLVLQASVYAQGGEIFILDMGEPVKIDDMARNLIRLSGYTPDVDIMIEYTGLRPGEKLYEELLMREEGLKETDNKLIHIGKPIEMDDEWFEQTIRKLERACNSESDEIRELVSQAVPTYHYTKSDDKTLTSV